MSDNLDPISVGLNTNNNNNNNNSHLITSNLNNITSININTNLSRKSVVITNKTPQTSLMNERELISYLNISKPDVLRTNTLVENTITLSKEENADLLKEIKTRVKKERVKPRPVSEADLGQKSISQQLYMIEQHVLAEPNSFIRHNRHENALFKELMQLSIKKEKVEKALAATGYQNSSDAINWLMKHSKDPLLNSDSATPTREYMLALCPIGKLATQIAAFLQQSKIKCSPPNEALFNNLLPYMKLTSFFKVYNCMWSKFKSLN